MWLLDRVARAYGVRPSVMIGVGDDWGGWLAYTFDRAVWLLGQWVEARLADRDGQGRAVWSLATLLDESGPVMATTGFGGADQLMALVGEGARVKP